MPTNMDRSDLPGRLDRDRHVELSGRHHQPWGRRAVLAVLGVMVLLGLLNVFGQHPVASQADTARATLRVKAPERLRGGLFYQGRIDVVARDRIGTPTLRLGPGFSEGMQINTIEPSPAAESSSAGRLELEFDPLHQGDHLTVWMQFEVNPTDAWGRREQSVTLLDGDQPLTAVQRKVTVFP
jgi:hypothetical protein